jgi:hypothetical protein
MSASLDDLLAFPLFTMHRGLWDRAAKDQSAAPAFAALACVRK